MIFTLLACDPYAGWPDPLTVYPYVYTPEADVADYEQVRWETETWDPATDTAEVGLYLQKALLHRPGAPVETLEHFALMNAALPPLSGPPDLSFAGDVMWVGENWSSFAAPAAGLLDGAWRQGNLETPVSSLHATEPAELGLYRYNAPESMLDALPFHGLQLNNNHSLDVDDDGLEATVAAVVARGYTGTGVDTHAVVEVDGRTVTLLSYTWGLNRRDMTSTHELFVVPFGHPEPPSLTAIEADIAAAEGTVVVLLHWGFEYEYYPDPVFMQQARAMVAAGADIVVGSGPHVAQPAELCHVNDPSVVPGVGTCSVRDASGEPREAVIFYSLGNFGTTMPTLPCQAGIVGSVRLGEPIELGWSGAITLQDGDLSVWPLDDVLDDGDRRDEAERLEAHLGAGWKR